VTLQLDSVIAALDYDDPRALVDETSIASASVSRQHVWDEAARRIDVDAAFFEGAVPLVYFRGLSQPSEAAVEREIRAFHHRAWSQGRAPLLVVVLPNQVRVLDGLTPWDGGPEIARASADDVIEQALAVFRRSSVLSGAVRPAVFPQRRRSVVSVLRAALKHARERLKAAGLDDDIANALLGRSMYMRHLADRGILHQLGVADAFMDMLDGPTEPLYELFGEVYGHLNGDVFPVTEAEREVVRGAHLGVVGDFLRGRPDGQLDLFPLYDFSVIPAELLSNVYEEFLTAVQQERAVHYTPEHVADLLLDELMPAEQSGTPKILDPACGSGTFLARAFRRMIHARAAELGRRLEPPEMSELLLSNVYGCDLLAGAVRVAALSCYLVLLEHCRDEEIAAGVRLPSLLDNNLVVGDFFAVEDRLSGPFDVVVTNPPWQSRLSGAANEYAKQRDLPVGDEQVSQVFYAACVERLADRGRAGLLMPAKVLYNQSSGTREFRRWAVGETGLELIVDFSPFRRKLFHSSVAPMAMLVARGGAQETASHLTFCTPRRSPASEVLGRIVVSGAEIKRVPRAEATRRPQLLKSMHAGTLRDADLLDAWRRRHGTLREREISEGWKVGSGYQLGTPATIDAPWLSQIRKVPVDGIEPLCVRSSETLREHASKFRRAPRDLFTAPLVIVARTPRRGRVRAAWLDTDAAFTASAVGVRTRSLEDAIVLAAILCSELSRYALLLTSTTWGVERNAVDPQDLRGLPIAHGDRHQRARLVEIARNAESDGLSEPLRRELDEVVFAMYGLSEADVAQVEDFVAMSADRHESGPDSPAFHSPSRAALREYREVLERRLASVLSVEVSTAVVPDQPYTQITIGLGVVPRAAVTSKGRWYAIAAAAQDEGETAIILRRTVLHFDGREITLAKPTEARNFTRSAAQHDVDEIVDSVLGAAAGRSASYAT
jgi:hypothetical protein